MNKGKLGAIIAVALIGFGIIGAMTCTTKVKPGYVAVQYSVNGGVKDEILTQGWHITSPGIKTTSYSIATETFVMSEDERAGSKEDESFSVSANDGILNVDFEMQYSYLPENVVKVFNKYRGIDGETVVSTNLRSRIKTVVNEVLSNYSVLEVHLEKKAEINEVLTKRLREVLSEYGITVESATLPATRVSSEVQQSITNRTIKAQELEAEKMNQEKIKLEAETAKIKAEGEAKAKIIEAQAEADANKAISESITQNIIDMKLAEAREKHGWVEVNGASTVVTK